MHSILSPNSYPTSNNNHRNNDNSSASAVTVYEEDHNRVADIDEDDVEDFAAILGVDLEKEPYLRTILEEGLLAPLPLEWKPCKDNIRNQWYYYNSLTKASQWEHPLNQTYREKIDQIRQDPFSLTMNYSTTSSSLLPPTGMRGLPPLKKMGASRPPTQGGGGRLPPNNRLEDSLSLARPTTSTMMMMNDQEPAEQDLPNPSSRMIKKPSLILTGEGANFMKKSGGPPTTGPASSEPPGNMSSNVYQMTVSSQRDEISSGEDDNGNNGTGGGGGGETNNYAYQEPLGGRGEPHQQPDHNQSDQDLHKLKKKPEVPPPHEGQVTLTTNDIEIIQQMNQTHQSNLNKLKNQMELEEEQLKAEHERNLQKLREQLNNDDLLLEASASANESAPLTFSKPEDLKSHMDWMKDEQRKQIQQMKDYHQTFIEKLRKDLETEEREMREEHETKFRKLREELESLTKNHETKIEETKGKYLREEADLEQKLKNEATRLHIEHNQRILILKERFSKDYSECEGNLRAEQDRKLQTLKTEFDREKAAVEKEVKAGISLLRHDLSGLQRTVSSSLINNNSSNPSSPAKSKQGGGGGGSVPPSPPTELKSLTEKYEQLERKYATLKKELRKIAEQGVAKKQGRKHPPPTNPSSDNIKVMHHPPRHPHPSKRHSDSGSFMSISDSDSTGYPLSHHHHHNKGNPVHPLNGSSSPSPNNNKGNNNDERDEEEEHQEHSKGDYEDEEILNNNRHPLHKEDSNSVTIKDTSSDEKLASALKSLELLRQQILEIQLSKGSNKQGTVNNKQSNNNNKEKDPHPQKEKDQGHGGRTKSNTRSSPPLGPPPRNNNNNNNYYTRNITSSSTSIRSSVPNMKNHQSQGPQPHPHYGSKSRLLHPSRSASELPGLIEGEGSDNFSSGSPKQIMRDAKEFIRSQMSERERLNNRVQNYAPMFTQDDLNASGYSEPNTDGSTSGIGSSIPKSNEKKRISKDIEAICSSLTHLDEQMKMMWNVVGKSSRPSLSQSQSQGSRLGTLTRTSTAPSLFTTTTTTNSNNPISPRPRVTVPPNPMEVHLHSYPGILQRSENAYNLLASTPLARVTPSRLLNSMEKEIQEFKTTKERLLDQLVKGTGGNNGSAVVMSNSAIPLEGDVVTSSSVQDKTKDLKEWLEKI